MLQTVQFDAMIPEPTLSFILQSLHDQTLLDCRVYHPLSLSPTLHAPTWHRHTAIFAHPYAPLGGSYDDRIVKTVIGLLLRQGYMVGTFNFRGGGGSPGHTSWTGKPECGDYMSMVGFLVYYAHHLDPFPNRDELVPSRQVSLEPDTAKGISPVMILGGYSYGSLITSKLPPLLEILHEFGSPPLGTTAAEIRTRAKHLAMNQNAILSSIFETRLNVADPRNYRHSFGIRVGGWDTIENHGRESRRSLSLDAEDKIRKRLSEVKARLTHRRKSKDSSRRASSVGGAEIRPICRTPVLTTEPHMLDALLDLVVPNDAYLLVSPLQGVISNLATFSFLPTSFFRPIPLSNDVTEKKLCEHPTLAVYGDKDIFVPIAKLRSWNIKLSSRPNSHFQGTQIPNAGHFWSDKETFDALQTRITEFITSLISHEK